MRRRGLVPSGACYLAVACAHAAAGDWREGVEVVKAMPPDVDGKRSPVITYTALIQSLDRVGRPQEGLEVLEFMKGEKGCTPNAVTYATLAGSFARHGEIDEAETVLKEMKQRGFKPDVRTWSLLLSACAQQALHQKVRQLLLDMKRSGCDPDVRCFESLVLAYANDGRVSEGLELLRGLMAKGVAVRQSVYAPLLGACAKARDVALAKM